MPKIMLVEDDHTMRSLLKTLLEMEGFTVLFGAGHAENLFEELRREKPELVVMDVHLAGGVNGIDLLNSIREDPDLKHTRIIMTSGMDYRTDSLKAGADAFLQKPYMVEDLLALLRQQINSA